MASISLVAVVTTVAIWCCAQDEAIEMREYDHEKPVRVIDMIISDHPIDVIYCKQ